MKLHLNRQSIWQFSMATLLSVGLAACGSSGDSESSTGSGLDDTIPDADVRSVRMTLSVPSAGTRSASVPGQRMGTLVDGATVTVEVIQPDGSTQTVEATVTDEGNGQYEINLPPDAGGLRTDCIIVAATDFNGTTITLRAPFVATEIEVNAASEFLTRELNTLNRNFGNISVDELRNQLNQVQGFTIPEDSDATVEDILDALEAGIGGDVREGLSEAERESVGPGSASAIAGRYNGGFLEIGFSGATGEAQGSFGLFETDNSSVILELAQSSPDELRVTRFDFRDAGFRLEVNGGGSRSFSSFADSTFESENDFEADYRVVALADGSFVFPGITEVQVDREDVNNASPEASIEVFRDYRFYPSGDGQVFFATFAGAERTYRAVDTDDDGVSDSADLSDQILLGYDRDVSVFIRQPTAALQASDFTGNYVFLGLEAGAERNGQMFGLSSAEIVAMNNGTVNFPGSGDFEVVKRNGQTSFSEDQETSSTETIAIGSNGAVTINEQDGNSTDGFSSQGGDVLYFPFSGGYDQNTSNEGRFVGQALFMRVPDNIPSGLNGKKYRLQLLEFGFEQDGIGSEFSAMVNAEISFSGEGAATTMTIDRTQDFIQRSSDTSVPRLEAETERFVFSAGQDMGNSNLRFIDGTAQLDLYFSDDLGLILMRFKDGGSGEVVTSMLAATPIN